MMVEITLKMMLLAIVSLAIALATSWVVSHPNKSRANPGRLRMPKFIVFVGWLFVAVGGFFFFISVVELLTGHAERSPVGGVITCSLIWVCGLLFVGMYRNFYVHPKTLKVDFRTIWGKEKSIAYENIVAVKRFSASNGRTHISIKAADGTKLSLDPGMYDLSLMFAYLEAANQSQQHDRGRQLRGQETHSSRTAMQYSDRRSQNTTGSSAQEHTAESNEFETPSHPDTL